MPRRQSPRRSSKRPKGYHFEKAPQSLALVQGVDNGAPLTLDPQPYIAASREPGWGPFLERFLNRNEAAFSALGMETEINTGRHGVQLRLIPGIKAGAVPLQSAVTGRVMGGAIIRPRFGWAGVGNVLRATGWGSGPEFLSFPLVPGSGKEIPPWVIAGPVLRRLTDMLSNLCPGYRERFETRTRPRGQVVWTQYIQSQLTRGSWHRLPCRFSQLEYDDRLRQAIRWTLERLHTDLVSTGTEDLLSRHLLVMIKDLIGLVKDVRARQPVKGEFEQHIRGPMTSDPLREGFRAMQWVVDERGLGGGRNSDGLAWSLSLDQLWERYVEHLVREQAARTGGQVRVGRMRETTVPIPWARDGMRSLGHLVPDFVVYRPHEIEIVDAKYKPHFADLDGLHWSALQEHIRDSMRADIHQVLAYAATVDSSQPVKATLFYPVSAELFAFLRQTQRVSSNAAIAAGKRTVTLSLRAAPFGISAAERKLLDVD